MSWRKKRAPVDVATYSHDDEVPIPNWLENSLLLWLSEFFYDSDSHGTHPNVTYCLAVERLLRTRLFNPNDSSPHGSSSAVLDYLKTHPRALWQVIDERLAALSALQNVEFPSIGAVDAVAKIKQLRLFLIQAGAGYEVSVDQQRAYLRRRIPGGVQVAIDRAEEAVASSSALLRSAFTHTYGREPNYGLAYSEAVKAVETAAIPIVIPKDSLGTLGKVIGQMRSNLAAWSLALADPHDIGVEALVNIMDTLWSSQHDRHGGARELKDMMREEAEAAVHLAALLVQWFGRTGIRAARA